MPISSPTVKLLVRRTAARARSRLWAVARAPVSHVSAPLARAPAGPASRHMSSPAGRFPAIEAACLEPPIYIIPDYLSRAECEVVIQAARGSLVQSWSSARSSCSSESCPRGSLSCATRTGPSCKTRRQPTDGRQLAVDHQLSYY